MFNCTPYLCIARNKNLVLSSYLTLLIAQPLVIANAFYAAVEFEQLFSMTTHIEPFYLSLPLRINGKSLLIASIARMNFLQQATAAIVATFFSKSTRRCT